MRDWSNVRPEDMRGKTHRELYPEQYTHPLVGKKVRSHGEVFTVERVVGSRFGKIAIVPNTNPMRGYAVSDCKEVL